MKKTLLIAAAAASLSLSAQTTMTYTFTGAMQTFTVPACVTTVTITCYGSAGQYAVANNPYGGGTPGLGGMATGTLSVTTGQVLNIFVGDTLGYNGGGTGGMNGNDYSGIPFGLGASGGGASDVRVGGTSLNDRIIVAGGGGGAGNQGTWPGCQVSGPAGNGGAGGGTTGGTGGYGVGTPCNCGGGGGDGGTGGSQVAGGVHGNYYGSTACLRSSWNAGQDGTFGQGGSGHTSYHNGSGGAGGGGGGYYGGGAGGNGSDTTPGGGGGGGSSYTGGVASGSTTAGVRVGNGMVTIEYNSGAPGAIGNIYTTTPCANDTFIMSTDPVLGATSYVWSMPAGCTILSGQGTMTVTIVCGTTSGLGSLYASNSCGDGPTVQMNINVNYPAALDLGADTVACAPVVLTADSNQIYQWCSGQTTQSITASTSGQYCVATRTNVGCWSYDTINVSIGGTQSVVASASMNMVCIDDDTVQLMGSPAGGTWTGSCVVNGNQFDPGACAAGTYSFVYTFTDSLGCSGMDTTTVTSDLCLDVVSVNDNEFTLFPNPASTSCVIIFASEVKSATIEITNLQGQVIQSQQIRNVNAQSQTTINLENIAAGTYLLNVISGDTKSVRTLVVE